MFARALAAFLALPGVVAFLIPWLIRPPDAEIDVGALPILGVGVILLLWCVRDFYVVGRGTLAPWAPPTRLVTVGLYRYSRNPMYVSVLLIVAGWALVLDSTALWIYAGVLAVAFQLRVVLGEEPFLAEVHGQEWATYKADVPRWFNPFHARKGAWHQG
jgi:protein-S-isoprenylcysteine O-methyltransferase Ste14